MLQIAQPALYLLFLGILVVVLLGRGVQGWSSDLIAPEEEILLFVKQE